MLKLRFSLTALTIAAFSVTAGAQETEIYKSVSEDGVVEYSDMPSEDAQAIHVDPNVVEVSPERRSAVAQPTGPGIREQAADSPPENVEYVDDGVDRLQRRKIETKEIAGGIKEQHREGPSVAPAGGEGAHKGGRPAGGHRR